MHHCLRFLRLAPLAFVITFANATAPSPIVVNSTADTVSNNDGLCTLREAINSAIANSTSGAATGECAAGIAAPAVDTIDFNIPDSDVGCTGTPKVCTIQPASSLPIITEPVLIDGYSQPTTSANTLAVGDDALLLIELDATNLNPGLFLAGSGAGGSTVRGLVISHIVANAGIRATHVDNLTITGNFLGTDRTGTAVTATAYGVYADSGNLTVIGGTAPAARNVIDSTGVGIFIEGTAATNCIVQGNYLGVDKSGEAPLSILEGVQLRDTTGCLIGGSTPGAGNVIGKIGSAGISVDTELAAGGANNNVIQGNLIGTDASGTVAMGSYFGIALGSGDGNQIGGSAAGEGNLISGNAADGIIAVHSPTGTLIQGNKIGTDITGTLPLGNGWCGIDVSGFASGTNATVGGATAGAGNIIAFNGSNGISVTSNNTGWAILGNSIRSNIDMGIVMNGRCDDLTAQPTPNDGGDADSGSNNLQNYPVITTVTIGPKTMAHVSGTLNSTADTTFRVEFFANASCDPNGHGEGKVFAGSADVTTIGNDASFGPLDIPVPAHRHVITATATDPGNDTSEFSDCAFDDTIFIDGLEGD